MSEFERNEVVTTDYGYEDEPCYYETESDSKSGIPTAVKVVGGLGLAALAGGIGYVIGKLTGRDDDDEDDDDECEEDEKVKEKKHKGFRGKKQKKSKKKHKRSKRESDYDDEDDNVVDGECKEVK